MFTMALYETQDSFEYGRSFDSVKGDLRYLKEYAERHIGKHCFAGVVKNGEEYITYTRGYKGLQTVYLRVAPEVVSKLLEIVLDFCKLLVGNSRNTILGIIVSERKGYLAEISMRVFNEGVYRYLIKENCTTIREGSKGNSDFSKVNIENVVKLFESITNVSEKISNIKYDRDGYYKLVLNYEDGSRKGYLLQNGLLKYYEEE